MSSEQVRETMEAYWSAMRDKGDFGRFYAEDIVFETVPTGKRQTKQEAVDGVRALYGGVFEGAPEFINAVIGEDRAAVEAVFVGRHIGEFAGVPATRKAVRVPYSVFYELAGGVITRLRTYLSPEQIVEQLVRE